MGCAANHVFDLSGGHLALDFVNTVGGMRGTRPNDHLREYADLLAFARQAGTVSERQAERIREEAGRRPAEAEAALAEAKVIREALHGLLLARAEGRPPPAADLAAVNAALARALSHRRLAEAEGRCVLGWEELAALDAAWWPALAAGAELLASSEAGRVRVCGMSEEGECGWLFLDRSRARTRRWCSMRDCGNRAKARRHYRRVKERAGG